MERSELKNALLETISCMLSHMPDVRGIAEERVKALEVTEEYGLHLLDIILTTEEALEERQMAAVLLKQYVESVWTNIEGDRPSVLTSQVRDKIRSILPTGLWDVSGKIRNHVAYILAWIAADDFPTEWPTMCETIFSKESDSNVNVKGIVEFIKNFGGVADREQIEYCFTALYTTLYKICSNAEKYSPEVRADAVHCTANVICWHISHKKIDDRDSNMLMKFCEMFANQLILPHPVQSNFDLKSRILRGYTLFLNHMPERVVNSVVKFLPIIWQIFTTCTEMFDQVLDKDISPDRDPNEDEDDEPKFYNLTFDMCELLFTLIETHISTSLEPITTVLSELLYNIILLMGISKPVEVSWKQSADTYIEDDLNEDYNQCSVRFKARDLLLLITVEMDPSLVLPSLTTAVNRHLECSKLKSETYYWRIMEATMFAVGSMDTFILSQYKNNELFSFDIAHYLTQWAQEIQTCPTWLLLARIVWVGGKYSLILCENNFSIYMATTIQNLRDDSFILRFSAIRAISLHLSTMNQSQYHNTYMEILIPIAHALINALENSEGDIVTVGIHGIEDLLKAEPSFIQSIESELLDLINNLFSRTVRYPEIITDLHCIVNQIKNNMIIWKKFEERFLSVITETMTDAVSLNGGDASSYDTLTSAITFLSTLVIYSPQPLSDNLIRLGFFRVCTCIMTIEESLVTQTGADCLRSYLHKAAGQLVNYRDDEGRTGVDYVLDVLKYTLDPQNMEYSCRQIGRLCITALQTLNTLLENHIDFMLRGVLSAMQRASQTQIEEGLLVIFAYLFNDHLQNVLTYLTFIPGPSGESALQFVLNKWLSKKTKFEGRYERNLSILALAKLVEHTILKHDERVIEVKIDNDPSRFGRAGLQAEISVFRKTEVPAPIMILNHLIQILAKEMGYVKQVRDDQLMIWAKKPDDEEYKCIGEIVKRRRRLQSDSTDYDVETSSNCDVLDLSDPVYNLQVEEFLSAFLKNLASSAKFFKWMPYLDRTDQMILFKLGIAIPL